MPFFFSFRNYRIGDLPDIQISNDDILKPLRELVFRDNHIAQKMFSAIVSSLMEKCEDEEKHQLIITIISKLNKFPFKNKYLASALFDICLKQSNVKLFSNLDAKSVQTLTINLNLEPLGIQLLLRKPPTDSEPVAKRSRTETCRNDQNVMDQEDLLATVMLYQKIDDYSSARGIFLEFKNDLSKKAYAAFNYENLGAFSQTLEFYKDLHENETDTELKQFWLCKRLNAMEKLSK